MKSNLKRVLSAVLCASMLFGTMITPYAEVSAVSITKISEEEVYGKLPVDLVENNHATVYFRVLKKGDYLYVRADSFAKMLGYEVGYLDNAVQFLQLTGEVSETMNFSFSQLATFYYDSTDVELVPIVGDRFGEVTKYTAPVKTLNIDGAAYVPFAFAVKIMDREMVINNGTIMISSAHERLDDAIAEIKFKPEISEEMIALNRVLEENQFLDAKTSTLLSACAACEYSLFKFMSGTTPMDYLDYVEEADLSEAISFLVSNTAPQTSYLYASYGELMTMYLNQELFSTGMDAVGAILDNTFDVQQFCENGVTLVEESARKMIAENGEGLCENDAFASVYEDLLGYSPSVDIWTCRDRYDFLLSSLLVNFGDPNVLLIDGLNLLTGNFQLGYVYGCLTGLYNTVTRDEYSAQVYKKYLSIILPAYKGSDSKYAAFLNAIMDQINYTSTAEASNVEGNIQNMIEVWIEGYITGLIPGGDIFYTFISYLRVFGDFLAYEEKNLLNDYTSYFYLEELAEDVRRNATDITIFEKEDLVYLYYKTEYLAHAYYKNVFSNSGVINYISDEDAASMRAYADEEIKDSLIHLATADMQVKYGLKAKDNKHYNSVYDDSYLLAFLEPTDSALGNTNANLNNGGLVVLGSENRYEAMSVMGQGMVYRENLLNSKDNGIIAQEVWSWLNIVETDDREYVFFVDEYGNIKRYDAKEKKTELVIGSNLKQLMIAYGYMYFVNSGVLYRAEMDKELVVGALETVAKNVGSNIYCGENEIYYTDEAGTLISVKEDEFGEFTDYTMYPIKAGSFDMKNGMIYYTNLSDKERIYAYNIATGIDVCLGEDTEHAYNLIFYNGSIFYKKNNKTDSGLVYSLIPFADISLIRAYTIATENVDSEYCANAREGLYGGLLNKRRFNIVGNQIYNQPYFMVTVQIPMNSVSKFAILEMALYRIGKRMDKASEAKK